MVDFAITDSKGGKGLRILIVDTILPKIITKYTYLQKYKLKVLSDLTIKTSICSDKMYVPHLDAALLQLVQILDIHEVTGIILPKLPVVETSEQKPVVVYHKAHAVTWQR